MNFLWRSVVGKLWMTIIVLVTVVLFILTLFLAQFFDRFYYDQQYGELKSLAFKVASIFETYENKEHALQTAKELAEISRARLLVVEAGNLWDVTNNALPNINIDTLFADEELHQVFYGNSIVKRAHFPIYHEEDLSQVVEEIDVIIVGVPLYGYKNEHGAVFLYQSLDVINQTIDRTRELMLYAVGIGIILTTIFAFFLSTRITSPLRQMKRAADNMAEGDFHSRVKMRSNDEIGDLANTFNHMAEHLNQTIHALSQEKEQLSSILRSMVDGVITLDVQGKIILMNPPAERMLQTLKYEENMVDNTDGVPKVFYTIFEEVLCSKKDHVQTITAQGRYWTVVMAPLYNQDVIRGVVAVIRDMTEEKRLDKLRKDFVANVSHELRTPLSMMQGYSEALVDDIVASEEERTELAKIIYDESLRMGRLVNELLDLARMEAGHVQLELSKENLDSVLIRTVRKFSSLAKEQRVNLNTNIGKLQHQYLIDSDRIEQVITNLMDNAIRHSKEDGQVEVELIEKAQEAIITIKDAGDGIAEDDLPFIFERFYKADKARTRGKSGTGIGLSIVKHLVEAHGGHISVGSRLGQGTIFTIHLPKMKE